MCKRGLLTHPFLSVLHLGCTIIVPLHVRQCGTMTSRHVLLSATRIRQHTFSPLYRRYSEHTDAEWLRREHYYDQFRLLGTEILEIVRHTGVEVE